MLDHIYRIIFNHATGCYKVVSEIAKSGSRYSNSVCTDTEVTGHDKI